MTTESKTSSELESPHEIERAFTRACDALPPMRRGARLLLGCSAGGDSMGLLTLVQKERAQHGWQVSVAHYDHAQRAESADEARFVEERCRELGIALVIERAVERDPASAPSSEAMLRESRYAFFGDALARTNAEALVLAHQADDRAETFIMRLLAGSGPTGLSSIRAVDEIDGLIVARPLLGLRREQLREYLRQRGLAWHEDASNDDERYKRAWVRRRAMPLFQERMGLDVTARIVRASELIEEESDALEQAAAMILERITASSNPPALEELFIGSEIWRKAEAPLRRRLMRRWLWNLCGSPHPPGYAAVDEALKFAGRAAESAQLRTVDRIHILKREGKLIAFPSEPPAQPLPQLPW